MLVHYWHPVEHAFAGVVYTKLRLEVYLLNLPRDQLLRSFCCFGSQKIRKS
jgi:hypothetical protein